MKAMLREGTQRALVHTAFLGHIQRSPIVAGAVACLQVNAKSKNGTPLKPEKVRQVLMKTGTPQEKGPSVPLTQRIGPLPNLLLALKQVAVKA
ncbi:MAG: hypothetical protein ACR2MC_05050 [Actinomycetota bacterium]